jgi:sugar lactone lactonase YvrE
MRKLLLVVAAGLCVRAADPEPRWLVLNREARQAIEARDYARLRSALLELRPLMPGNPRITYNLAAAEARLGNREGALARLRNWAGMGLLYDVAADEDFATLKGLPEFQAIVSREDESRDPVARSQPAFQIAEPDLLPEDIAYDPRSRRFFVSSVRKAKIITGEGQEFAKADWPVLALAVDARRRLLWATTGWVPHCEACKPEDKDKTALLAFDLASGALKQRIESPAKGLLGDMTIGRKGDLYVSEGIHGAVFHLAPGGKELERLDTPGEFPSPQTPSLSADEKTLYVPDYARGIAAIDLATHAVEWLKPGDDIALSGIDGLYVFRGSFLAVQNGTTPPRIVRFSPDLKHQEILEANTPGLGEPTHGVLVGNDFYYLRNSGWNAYDQNGKKKAGAPAIQSEVGKITFRKNEAR